MAMLMPRVIFTLLTPMALFLAKTHRLMWARFMLAHWILPMICSIQALYLISRWSLNQCFNLLAL